MTRIEILCCQLGGHERQVKKKNELAREDHSHVAPRRERVKRYESIRAFSQRSSVSKTVATRDRSDCPAVVTEFRNVTNAVVFRGARYHQFIIPQCSSCKGSDRSDRSRKDKVRMKCARRDLMRTLNLRGKAGRHLPSGGTHGKAGTVS